MLSEATRREDIAHARKAIDAIRNIFSIRGQNQLPEKARERASIIREITRGTGNVGHDIEIKRFQ